MLMTHSCAIYVIVALVGKTGSESSPNSIEQSTKGV